MGSVAFQFAASAPPRRARSLDQSWIDRIAAPHLWRPGTNSSSAICASRIVACFFSSRAKPGDRSEHCRYSSTRVSSVFALARIRLLPAAALKQLVPEPVRCPPGVGFHFYPTAACSAGIRRTEALADNSFEPVSAAPFKQRLALWE